MQPTSQYQLDDIQNSSPFANINNLQDLGKFLQNTRKSYNIEISQIAADLRLKTQIIEALESGNWEELPGDAYAHGYVRQYASYLKLSEHEAAECCHRIKGKIESQLKYINISSTQEAPTTQIVWVSSFLLIAIFIIWAIIQNNSMEYFGEQYTEAPINLSNSEVRITPIRVNKNIRSTCLNIPEKEIITCQETDNRKPSIILKNSYIYPIWE